MSPQNECALREVFRFKKGANSLHEVTMKTAAKRLGPPAPGVKFGRLTVLSTFMLNGWTKAECLCDCGKKTVLRVNALRTGGTKSCGCLALERAYALNFKHGGCCHYKVTPEYSTWVAMRQRCSNENMEEYKNYGGRGIKVCDRWSVFEHFLSDMGKKPKGHSIDRIDRNGNYEPSNCKWSTAKQQARNTSKTLMVTFKGERIAIGDLCDRLGLSIKLVRTRITVLGWDIERALFQPKMVMKK